MTGVTATSRHLLALTRGVSPAFARCELTHLTREPIDVGLAERQHAAYEALLAELGCDVERLPVEPELPDSVFVEDAAVVLDELAVITRPGAASRRAETASVAAALGRHRPLVHVAAPATLDGGDVLRLGRRLFVGRSARTSSAGIAQLAAFVGPFGYSVTAVPLDGCLHLKTAVTEVADGVLLVNRAWLDAAAFAGYEVQEIDPAEPFAANALRVVDGRGGVGTVVLPAAFTRTRARLEARGIPVRTVDVSELAKAEGGVTCCSLLVGDRIAG
jgi:dimethylargininase